MRGSPNLNWNSGNFSNIVYFILILIMDRFKKFFRDFQTNVKPSTRDIRIIYYNRYSSGTMTEDIQTISTSITSKGKEYFVLVRPEDFYLYIYDIPEDFQEFYTGNHYTFGLFDQRTCDFHKTLYFWKEKLQGYGPYVPFSCRTQPNEFFKKDMNGIKCRTSFAHKNVLLKDIAKEQDMYILETLLGSAVVNENSILDFPERMTRSRARSLKGGNKLWYQKDFIRFVVDLLLSQNNTSIVVDEIVFIYHPSPQEVIVLLYEKHQVIFSRHLSKDTTEVLYSLFSNKNETCATSPKCRKHLGLSMNSHI
jgi:hypothetical protein